MRKLTKKENELYKVEDEEINNLLIKYLGVD